MALTLLQSLLMPGDNGDCQADMEMFFRANVGTKACHVAGGMLELAPGSCVTFDTYYNCFPYPTYLKYTLVTHAVLRLALKGNGSAELIVYDGKEHTAACGDFSFAEPGKLDLDIDLEPLPKNGILYLRLKAAGNMTLYSAGYYTDARPLPVSCCIVICTYRREAYVKGNTAALEKARIPRLDRVLVVDNGSTLDAEDFSGGQVSVIRNKNLGGSGGFTRGMLEAAGSGFTHLMLMDDDISFYPETIARMLAFLSVLKSRYGEAWLSAAMLSMERKYIQYEMGGNWTGRVLESLGQWRDLRDRDALLENQRAGRTIPNYAAWWCLAMPVSVISDYGLPMPFFIKYDDVEYGLRRNPDRSPIITMNGISVTHEDFYGKYNPVLEYYGIRNSMVTNAVHGINSGIVFNLRRMLCACGRQLMLYRYDCLGLIIEAYRDFLGGTAFFKACDGEKKHRELMAGCQREAPLCDIPGWDESLRVESLHDERYFDRTRPRYSLPQLITLGGHLMPWFLLKRETAAIPVSAERWQDCFMRKMVIEYQPHGVTGVLCERSFKRFLAGCISIAATAVRLVTGLRRAQRDYRENAGNITDGDFHRKHLGI